MPKLVPVDFDPFADNDSGVNITGVKLTPVDFDPFEEEKPAGDVNKPSKQLGGKSYRDLYDEMMPANPVRMGKEAAKSFVRFYENTLSGLGGLTEYAGHMAERQGRMREEQRSEPVSSPLVSKLAELEYGGPPPSSEAVDFLKTKGKAVRQYFGEAANDPILKPRVESYTDIKSIADGIDYASTSVGNLLGSVSFMALMPGVYKPAEVAGVIGKEGLKRSLGGRALNFLKPQAMDVPIGAMEGGEIANKQLEEYEKNGTDLSLSRLVATAVPATLVERGLGVEALAAKMGRMGPQAREFAKKNLVPRILQGMGIAGVGEGGEEFVQTYLENYGGDPKSVWTKETLHEAINAGLQGMIGGHIMGGAGGAMAKTQAASVDNQQQAQQNILLNPIDYNHPAAQKMVENRANVARYLEDYIAETDPQLAKAWGEQAAAAIGANQPIDMSIITGSGKFDMTDFTNPPATEQTTPVQQEVQDHQKYKPFIDGIAQKLDAGEYSMDDLHGMRALMAEKYGPEHGSVGALDDFIEKRNLPPGVKDGMDMVNKALATNPLDDDIINKMRQGTGGSIVKNNYILGENSDAAPYEAALAQMNRTPLDEAQEQLERFPQTDRRSVAGITRKQPGMPRPRTDAARAEPVQEVTQKGPKLGGAPIAMPGRVSYTAADQRRPLEVAAQMPEKDRVLRSLYESLEKNNDRAEGVDTMIIEAYIKDGGIIPANRHDLALKYPSAFFSGDLDAKAHEAATSLQNDLDEPTAGQIKAGNYQKGHLDNFHGLDVTVENPKGSFRKGTSPDGKKWKTKLHSHYGYIKRTVGADGDHLDTFIGDNPESRQVFVVYQNDPKTGKFDEHKVMMGYNAIQEARQAYLANYEKGWKGLGNIVPMSMDTFKTWMNKLPSTFTGKAVHATTADFENFDDKFVKEGGSHGTGHYFSDSDRYGKAFGEALQQHEGKPYRLLEVVFKDLNLLDLDAPITPEQRGTIDEALRELGTSVDEILEQSRQASLDKNWSPADFASTDTLVFALESFMGPRQASKLLHDLSFHGNRYTERGATNFVIFSAADIYSVTPIIDNRLESDTINKEVGPDGTDTRAETGAPGAQEGSSEVRGGSGEREVRGPSDIETRDEGVRGQEENGREELTARRDTSKPSKTKPAKALVRIVLDMGGLSAEKVKAAGFNVKEDFQQYGLSFVFRKNGRGLDDIATELISSGKILPGPDTISSDNYVLSLLQAAARGQKVTIDQIQEEINTVVNEQKNDIMELREELKRDGYDESQIQNIVAAYQRETREAEGLKEIEEDAGEARARGAETLDDDFVSEVEEPTGELFNTDSMFTLSGNQPHEQKTMKVPEKKGERLFDVKKQDVDDLKDRLSGEKAKREFEEEKQAAEKLEDFGEKIGGARKDTAERGLVLPKGERKEDTKLAWKKRFIAMERVNYPGTWVIADTKAGPFGRTGGQTFQSLEEAEKAIPLYAVAQQHQVFSGSGDEGGYSIYRKVGERKRIKVVNQTFPSREEAMKYMALHAEELLNIKTSFGEEILPVPEKAYRKGPERRTDKATPEMFMETFAPRGIEFGNWNNQEERQQVMNHAYDGLLDLADALGVPPKALMLNGELAIAFGARGQGLSGAKAHYELDYGVINLTKMKGAGSLAHEWMHGFDHYLGRLDTKASSEKKANAKGDLVYKDTATTDMLSHGASRKSALRQELREAYQNVIDTMYKRAEQYVEDTEQADRFIEAARENLRETLNSVRRYVASDYSEYQKNKFGKPATAEQLAELDRLVDILVEGGDLETKYKASEKTTRNRFGGGRYTNDTLEAINAIIKAVRNRLGFNSEQTGYLDKVVPAMGVYSARIKMLEDAKAGTEKTRKRPTSYAIEAKKMDQARTSDYWSHPHEMVARAFAAYVEDKVAERGGQSDFLVYHAHGGILLPMIDGFVARPYPEGAEREAINKAFDEFVGVLETRETNKGVMFFKKGEGEDDKPSFRTAVTGTKVKTPYKAANLQKLLSPTITRITERTGVTVKIIQDNYGFPADFLERAGADFDIKNDKVYGALDPLTDTIYLVADNAESTSAVEKTLFEELVGHKGLPAFLGEEKATELRSLVYNQFKVDPAMKKVIRDYGLDVSIAEDRLIAGNEFMIHNIDRPSIMQRVIAYVREALRSMGFKVRYSDADLKTLIGGLMNRVEASMMGEKDIERGLETSPAFREQKPAPTFYSQLFNTVDRKLNDMPAKTQSVIPWLRKNQVKPMELEEMGVSDWLKANQKDGRIDKAAFAQWVKDNQIQVQEITRGGTAAESPMDYESLTPEMQGLVDQYNDGSLPDGNLVEEAASLGYDVAFDLDGDIDTITGHGSDIHPTKILPTKFHNYMLPGGGNYRELLFTVAEPGDEYVASKIDSMDLPQLREMYRRIDINGWETLESEEQGDVGQLRAIMKENLKYWREGGNWDDSALQMIEKGNRFYSGHWSEPNVLAHARMQDFTDAEGNKVLLVEEVQSDWHQAGKKEGYASKEVERPEVNIQRLNRYTVGEEKGRWYMFDDGRKASGGYATKEAAQARVDEFTSMPGNYPWVLAINGEEWQRFKTEPEKEWVETEVLEWMERQRRTKTAVPPAPFKQNWHEYVLKRLIRYAAENGYSKLAWTPGEQQAERYDLSKQIDAIRFNKMPDGNVFWTAEKDGERVTGGDNKPSELENFIGKEPAQKIIAHGEGPGVLSGLDLKVGGKGMKVFYDQLIPGFMNRYVKQWGAKVGETKINGPVFEKDNGKFTVDGHEFTARWKAEKYAEENGIGPIGTPVPSIPITPAMREAVLYEGQPLYKKDTLGGSQQTALRIGKRLGEEVKRWKGVLSDYFNHTLKGQHLPVMMNTPQVLRLHRIGMKDLPMAITADTLTKTLGPRHGLTRDLIEQLPVALTTPIMVLKSATVSGSFVVMTELQDNEGRWVIVPVRLNYTVNSMGSQINQITSVYGRENNALSGKPEWFIDQVKEGNLVYMDKEKALRWSESARLQLPLERAVKNLKNRIHTETDIVKPEFAEGGISFKKEKAVVSDLDLEDVSKKIRASLPSHVLVPVGYGVGKAPSIRDSASISAEGETVNKGEGDEPISFKKEKADTSMDDLLSGISKTNPKLATSLKNIFSEIDELNKETEPLGEPTKEIPDPKDDSTKKTASWLNRETGAIFRTIATVMPGNMPHNSFLENVLKSPEWYQHPVFKNIVRLFTMDRERLYHTTMIDLSTVDDQSVIEETDKLRKKNPGAYKELLFAIDYGDTKWKRGEASMKRLSDPDISEEARKAVVANQVKKYEEYLREKRGVSSEAIRVWKLHRASYDKALDMMTAQLRALVAQMEEGEATGQTKTVLQELRFALASMNEWRGFYAPRLRDRAGYAVQAEKTHGDKTERYREHRSKYGAERLAGKLREEGWKNVTITEMAKLPESVYMNLKAVDVAKAIKDASQGMKGEAAIAFNDELIEHVSNLIKSRGYRSSMIHRGSPDEMGVVKGYMEDPLERYTTYVNNLAGGFSKAQVAQRAMQMLLGERDEDGSLQGGIDAKTENRTYVTAERYIAEQLRNLDHTDRIVGLAKSIATFKYLGFNPRSAFVNMTALATTVPAAIHQYVMGGKGSMTKVLTAVGKAGTDIATVMVGKKLKDNDEQAFIDRIKREGYDDPQLTRDVMGKIDKIHKRAWSTAMTVAMWMFSKTEQFNRLSTMLAGYRLAKAAGNDEEQAYNMALDASNKAHGLYGRGTLPAWAQGGNPAAKAGQMLYVYGKFGHNYLQMMYDLGFKKHDAKAFLWGFASPIVLAGGAAWPLKDLMVGIINFFLKLFGFKKGDAEKFVYDGIRTHLGKTAEMGARHGLTGLAGIDISGSLSIGVGVPKNMWELTGAAGGVYEDAAKALHFLSTDQPGRALEKALPTGFANPLRAFREGSHGVTSEKGRPLFDDETGTRLELNAGQMALRAGGFRPSEQAVLSERKQEHRDLVKTFDNRRDAIYEQARAYYADPDRNSVGMTKLMQAQTDYNQSIRDAELAGLVPFMKYSSLREQAKALRRGDKRERRRLQRDAEDEE